MGEELEQERNRRYQAEWYQRNKLLQQERTRAVKRRNREYLKVVRASSCCARCPERHPVTLDFHHRDPEMKDRAVGLMAERGVSIKRLQGEIDKCDVLCSNCHRKLHAEERTR